jgi:hypothetical protein
LRERRTLLTIRIAQDEKRILIEVVHKLVVLQESWNLLTDKFLLPLKTTWRTQEEARQKEEAQRNRDPSEKLKDIARNTVAGMFGC